MLSGVVVVVAAAAAVIVWTSGPRAFECIDDGRVYKSGALSPAVLEDVVKEYGIRSVIDLRSVGDLDPEDSEQRQEIQEEARVLTRLGVRHHHLPSPQVPTPQLVDRFLGLMQDPSSYPVLIHCHHGRGRAVLYSALYRIELLGWDNERARQATRWRVEGSSFDLGRSKGDFLHTYVPRRERKPVVEGQAGES
jgi:protein tyrosine/serine phosphatase